LIVLGSVIADSMSFQGGQQEDAEEFFGFYLDALEEELLSVVNALSQPRSVKGPPVEEREEDAPQPDEGWLEVGKKNRTVVTRTVSH
jgi:ubiquitin carboxyl-terminal hydrolase 10